MFHYYFLIGLRSLRRNPALTLLMVVTLSIGVAASMALLTVVHALATDPIPQKSERLFAPLIDIGTPEGYVAGNDPGDVQVSYQDAVNFLNTQSAARRTAIYPIKPPVQPARADLSAFFASGIAVNRDFFSMFDTPFLYGGSWNQAEDVAGADLVVLGRAMSEKVFGNVNPVGQRLHLLGHELRVVGVVDHWKPFPRFYNLHGSNAAVVPPEEFFLPFATAIRHRAWSSGTMSCGMKRDPGFDGLLRSECTWLQFWFETPTAAGRASLQKFLDGYASEQRKLGRMLRKAPNKLYNVKEWLTLFNVVDNDSKLSVLLGFGFLALCLVNTVGILLAKFSARAAEIGIRRALGASRAQIFGQFFIESGVIGLVGGIVGLLMAFGALALIGLESPQMAEIAQMDWQMLSLTVILAIVSAVLAGLLPTWRACQVTPALQLKSQ